MNDYLLEMKNIEKSFFGVKVLDGVDFNLKAGEVHALMGENGAGKSTLMKILSGAYRKDGGEIYIEGKKAVINNPKDARDYGVAIVYQEISLVDQLSISDNMYLGAELKGRILQDKKQQQEQAQKMLDEFRIEAKATERVDKLSIAQQQMIEIAKAILFRAKILILDEPTASLSDTEAKKLFQQMKKLKEKGVSIIYISHRLPEIFSQTDRVTVLRDSQFIGTKETSALSEKELVRMMVGRDVNDLFDGKPQSGGETVLEVKGFSNRFLKNVSFQLRKGEILGFAGLVGAGRTELARAIYGIDKKSGELFINGKKVQIHSPNDSIRHNVVLVPEDRKRHGLVLEKSVAYNITLVVLKQFIHGIFQNRKREKDIVHQFSQKLSIKMKDETIPCLYLSGGNQQKVVVAKWLSAGAEILIFDEPTRGIDIGAKSDIYRLMYELSQQGKSIIMISSDMEEILNMSSRIAVMYEGKLVKVLERNFAEEDPKKLQEEIMACAVGGV